MKRQRDSAHWVEVPKKNFEDLTARPFQTKIKGRIFQGLVVRKGDKYFAYQNLCQHLPITLDLQDGQFFTHDKSQLQCHMHGAVYEIETGLCTAGPCQGARLIGLEVKEGEKEVAVRIPEDIVIPKKAEITVVGGAWSGPVMAAALRRHGQPCELMILPSRFSGWGAVSIGNGETAENARKIFGEELASKVWDLSTRNYERALPEAAAEKGTRWISPDGKDVVERGFTIDLEAFGERTRRDLDARGVRIHEADAVTIKSEKPWDYVLSVRKGKKESTHRTAILIFVGDQGQSPPFSGLHDKWIPVTLTALVAPRVGGPECALAILHSGADFGVASPEGWRLGSFRNLYEDRAVGRSTQPDKVTLENLRRFFVGAGWIATQETRTEVLWEALSCDGLPIVGELSEAPGVFVALGFAARSQNFLFEVAELLAQGIVEERGFTSLDCFSTKRFL